MHSNQRNDARPLVTAQIFEAIALLHGGQREAARLSFEAIWRGLDPSDAFHRCVLSHYMADAQENLEEELRWDLRALEAASAATPSDFEGRFEGVTLASFLPSLHLNLAADYEAIGRIDRAREHIASAVAADNGLENTDLARTTRAAIERLRIRLDAAE